MRSLEEPDAPRGRRLLWILLGAAMLGGLVAWYATTRSAPSDTRSTTPAGTARTDVPSSGNERATTTERPVPGARHETARRLLARRDEPIAHRYARNRRRQHRLRASSA